MSDILWCVHIIGPDDLHAHPTFEAAEVHAIALNTAIRSQEEKAPALKEITCRAVVAIWPWSPEAHAAAIAEPPADG